MTKKYKPENEIEDVKRILNDKVPEKQEKPAETKKQEDIDKEKRVEILKEFTKEVIKKYGPITKSIVLFGSSARGGFRGESDIDVFVIIDDTTTNISPAMRDEIEDELEYISRSLSPHLSVQQPYMLTEFWRLVREGHPIVFNFIREGVPIYDKDVFMPIKRLLQMGEIKPSKEAVEKFIERGPQRIKRVENAKIYMVVEDCYYAMIESLQAVLMFLGKIPPRPADAADEMRKTLVKMKFVTPRYAEWLEGIIKVRKDVEHKRKNNISGRDLDMWIEKSKKFIKKMQELIVKIEILKRENMVEKSYMIMNETVQTLLNSMKRGGEEPVHTLFNKHLVKTKMIHPKYLDVFHDLERMQKIVKKGKVLDIPKGDIMANREYVRKFIREAGRILKKKETGKSKKKLTTEEEFDKDFSDKEFT